MVSQPGQRTDPLITDLVGEPHRFSFFQAVRILEDYLGRDQDAKTRGRIQVGDIQIRPNTALGHPSSDVHDIEHLPPVDVDDESERFRITVNFMGLYGVDSPLPDFYLGDFAQSDDDEGNPQRAFLDVFHQRLYWLLYLSWRKYRHYIEYEADNSDHFSLRMFALIGLADGSMRGRLTSPPQQLLPFSSVLSRRECSASALRTILAKLLNVSIEIEEYMPRMVEIQPSQRQRLGVSNSRLGRDTTVGERICDIGSKFRVHIGPLSWNDFQEFLPGGRKRRELHALIGQILARPLAYDLKLMLASTKRRRFVLGEKQLCGLGRSSWLAAGENVTTTVVFEGEKLMLEVSLRPLIRRLSPYCRQALSSAAEGCIDRGNYEIAVEHLMLALLNEPNHDVHTIFRHFNVDVDRVQVGLQRQIELSKSGRAERPVYSELLIDWFKESWLLASVEYGDSEVRSGALLLAMALNSQIIAQLDAEAELDLVSAERLRTDFKNILESSAEAVSETAIDAAPGSNDLPSREGTPLDLYTQDFTAQARAGKIDPIFCRDVEIRQVIDILGRRRKNNPLAVGDAGVGKTALVEGLALKIAEGDVPESLVNVDLLALDLQAMQAGASVRGEFEKRLKSVIEGVKSSPKPIILFIDEVHTLIGAGGQAGTGDAANILKPALARGELRTIAATTWSEYKKYIEKDAALARRFQLVKLEEPSPEQATIILRGLRQIYEDAHDVYIRDDAVSAAAEMSARYISGRQLPDKSVDVLDTASARVKLSLSTKPAALDDMEKKVQILEREMNAITRDIETGIRKADGRVAELQQEIVQIRAEHAVLEERWQREKTLAHRVLDIRRLLKKHADSVDGAAEENAESAEREVVAGADAAEGDSGAGDSVETEAVANKSPTELKSELAKLTQELSEIQQGDPLVSHEASPDIVAQIIADWTGIPLGRMVRDQAASVLTFGQDLRKRIKGQDHAIDQIDRGIRASKAGISSPDGPIGVFLLVGPSGVGKTEAALGVADLMFGGERFVTTINMSEYLDKHAVSRLIGSAPGLVDSDKGGMLTEAVRQRPYSVVLLDEVEKADPEVMNLFYQVFDKGDLTDGQNLTVSFRNTIVFLTSNLTSEQTLAKWQQNRDINVQALLEEIRPTLSEHLKPALLGRMQIIPFFPLDDSVLREVTDLKLAKLTQRLKASQKIDLQYTPQVADQIVARCREVETGARNIDLVISNTLVPTIATEVLGHLGDEHMPERLLVDIDSSGEFSYTFS